jgi:hypothetical protein
MLEIAVITIIAAIGIAIITMNLKRKGELSEKPNELQFGRRKYIPPDGYVDTNVVKVGGTKTLASLFSGGSMKWDDFFNPKSEEHIKLRSTATYALLGFYIIAGLVTLTMAYLDLTWGYYFGLLIMAYATLIICVNYFKVK